MTEQELAEIEQNSDARDVHALIAEVRRLREKLTGYDNWVADAVEFYHLQPDCDGFDTWHEERQKAG